MIRRRQHFSAFSGYKGHARRTLLPVKATGEVRLRSVESRVKRGAPMTPRLTSVASDFFVGLQRQPRTAP